MDTAPVRRPESKTRALGWTNGVHTGWLIHTVDNGGRTRTARVGKCVRGHETSYRLTYRPLPEANLRKYQTTATLTGPKAMAWRRVPDAMVDQAMRNHRVAKIRARMARLEAHWDELAALLHDDDDDDDVQ